MEMSVASLGSSQTLRLPHFSTDDASRFCSSRLTIAARLFLASRRLHAVKTTGRAEPRPPNERGGRLGAAFELELAQLRTNSATRWASSAPRGGSSASGAAPST
jgi:hypothetical protein